MPCYFLLVLLGHTIAMPRKSTGPSGLDGEEPTPSDWLFWFFWKGSRVWNALDQARTACNQAEADSAWEYVAAKILKRFEVHGMTTKVEQNASQCFYDLEKLAREIDILARECGDARYQIYLKMVCVLTSGSAIRSN